MLAMDNELDTLATRSNIKPTANIDIDSKIPWEGV